MITVEGHRLGANRLRMLRMVAKRDHPGGEPRMGWLDKGKAGQEMIESGLVRAIVGTDDQRSGDVVVLTETGSRVLAGAEGSLRAQAAKSVVRVTDS